jgi:hypothetical protein
MNDYLTTASAEIEPTDSICDEKELESLEKEILGVKERPEGHPAFVETVPPRLSDAAEKLLDYEEYEEPEEPMLE